MTYVACLSLGPLRLHEELGLCRSLLRAAWLILRNLGICRVRVRWALIGCLEPQVNCIVCGIVIVMSDMQLPP